MGNFTVLFSILAFLLGSVDTTAVDPIIEPYPNNTFAIAGSTLSSICIVVWDHGKSPIRVKFQRQKKDGITWEDIPDTDRVYQTNKTEGNKTTATLHFRNVTVKDDASLGRHRCIVFSSRGKELESIGFILKVTPKEDLPVAHVTPNQTASFGDNVKLYCNLTHKNNEQTTPIDKVIFLKDGIPVKHTSDVTQPLILADVTARDGGDYGCILSVKLHGMKPYNVTPTTTAYVHIRVRFPFKESKVVADLGNSVALVCSAEGYPLNVTWNKNKPGSTAIIKQLTTERNIRAYQHCAECVENPRRL